MRRAHIAVVLGLVIGGVAAGWVKLSPRASRPRTSEATTI